jgi:hypothetical protein
MIDETDEGTDKARDALKRKRLIFLFLETF